MYGYHSSNKEIIYDKRMHLMSLGLAFQVPELNLMSIEKSASLLNENHKK